MAYTAQQILDLARTHLNDDNASLWPDWRLIPKLQAAQLELFGEIYKRDTQATMAGTAALAVPATPDASTFYILNNAVGFPSALIRPYYLQEKIATDPDTNYVSVKQLDALLPRAKSNYNINWAWNQNLIIVPGALVATSILMRYESKLVPVNYLQDDTGLDGAENFLAYKTAALALSSVTGADRNKIMDLRAEAANNLDQYIKVQVRQQQNLPVRQRGYQGLRRLRRNWGWFV